MIQVRKMKFISHIYTSFFTYFYSLFVKFWCILQNKRQENIQTDVFGYYVQ